MARKKYYQRPDGLYECSRRINGKRVVFRGRTCAEVDRKILEYNVTAKKGRKFPVIADEWLAMKEKEVAASTYKIYALAVRRAEEIFTDHIGEYKALDVQRYITGIERQGYAGGSVASNLGVIKQIFAFAVLAGDLDYNPVTDIRRGKNLPKTIRTALTEEQERIVERCRTGEWWWLGLLLLYTGVRRGELLALEWQDIDRHNGVIHITKKLNHVDPTRPVLETWLKSKNGLRDIPLFDVLADALPRNRIGRIFTDEHGNYLSAHRFGVIWKQYCSDAGLVDEHGEPALTPHQFRHSFATICYEAGIDPLAASAFLGDTEAVTKNIYTELRASRQLSAGAQVNEFVNRRQEQAVGSV